jgi:hypothetical protein
VSAAAVSAVVYVQPDDCTTLSLSLAVADGGVDGAFGTAANGTDGTINMVGTLSLKDYVSTNTPSLEFEGDTDTGLGHYAANTLSLITGGAYRLYISTTALTFTLPVDTGANHINSSTGILELGADMTTTHSLGTGAVGVKNALEVDGTLHLDGSLIAYSTAETESMTLSHDGTNGVVSSANGDISLTPASGEVSVVGSIIQTRQILHDAFVWGDSIYAVMWDLTILVGAGTNAIKAAAGDGGTAILTTGALASDAESTWTWNASFSRAINPHARSDMTLITDLVDKEVRFGFSDTKVADFTSGATDYAFIQFDESTHATEWYYVCSDAGTPTATLGTGPTAGTSQLLNVQLLSTGAAAFSVDGVVLATIAGCVNADTALYLGTSIITEGASAEVLEVDNIQGTWD